MHVKKNLDDAAVADLAGLSVRLIPEMKRVSRLLSDMGDSAPAELQLALRSYLDASLKATLATARARQGVVQ